VQHHAGSGGLVDGVERGREGAGVVDDQQVAGAQDVRQVADDVVLDLGPFGVVRSGAAFPTAAADQEPDLVPSEPTRFGGLAGRQVGPGLGTRRGGSPVCRSDLTARTRRRTR
jgi:hypothetical protein